MTGYRFDQLIDIDQVLRLLESHHVLSGMSYSMLDADWHVLAAVGWQEICARFHKTTPATFCRCRESKIQIKERLSELKDDHLEYRCNNGLIDVAIPIMIEGKHIATFFTGQFFYDDEGSDKAFFLAQADEFGFDPVEYLKALEQVPILSREYVRQNVLFLGNMVHVLAETGLKNLRLLREREVRKRLEDRMVLQNYALDHIREAAFLINEEGRFLYVNDGACRSLGYDRTELLAACVADIIPDFPKERWQKHWNRIKARGSFISESHNKTKDGRIFPVEVYANYFEYGGYGYNLALVHDISERKRMESLLKDKEQQFRALSENSPNIIIRYDRRCRRIYVNPAFTRETGIPADLAQNVDLEELWLADTNLCVAEYKSKVFQVIESGMSAEILLEWTNSNKAQIISHVFNLVAERDSVGSITGCLAIGHNISRLREAELRLTGLAATFPGVVFKFVLQPDGTRRMPYIAGRVAGYGLTPEVVNERPSEVFNLIHPDDRTRVEKSIIKSARTLSLWSIEYRVLRPDGKEVWVEGRSTPTRQPNGDIHWSGFLHNISDRKEMEKSLNAKGEQLASMAIDLSLAEERERRRIASVLHDHIGQLLLLGKIKLDSLAGVFTQACHRNTYNEIHEILTRSISDARSLTQQLNPPLLAKAGLEAALEWLAKKMDHDYSLQVDFTDDRRKKPLDEEFRAILFQSARELLINVAKHARTSRASLFIGREADTLLLTVEDRGAGFPLSPNFDTAIQQNSSFGLFNIRQRIRYLGGEMTIVSAPGCGTRATIRVPITDDHPLER